MPPLHYRVKESRHANSYIDDLPSNSSSFFTSGLKNQYVRNVRTNDEKKTYRETLPPAALDSGLLVSVLWAKVGFEAFLYQKSEILPICTEPLNILL